MEPVGLGVSEEPLTRQESSSDGLADAIAAVYSGGGQGAAMVEAFRRSVVLLPLDVGRRLLTADSGGIRWLLAFSTATDLARFAVDRGEGDRQWDYLTIFGWRLLDDVLPMVGGPAGVALDVASSRPMLFPPVDGIVPAPVAVATSAGGAA